MQIRNTMGAETNRLVFFSSGFATSKSTFFSAGAAGAAAGAGGAGGGFGGFATIFGGSKLK